MRAALLEIMRKILFSMLVMAGLSACTGSGQVTYSGEVHPPQLVEVSPGVQVVADYDQPVFYSDSYYWRYDNGVWYRSREHTRGWARVDVVPAQVRTIDRPEIYVHYHGHAQAAIQHNDNVEIRDQRDETPAPTLPPTETAPPTTTNVDIRENHEVIEHREVTESPRDTHKNAKEQRKDAKEQRKDAKEQRKDAKEQRKEDEERRKEEQHD